MRGSIFFDPANESLRMPSRAPESGIAFHLNDFFAAKCSQEIVLNSGRLGTF